MLLPWPAKQDRQADIAAARGEKERSQAAAARAAAIERDIRRLADDNHWAAAVARSLRNGEGP